MDIKPLKMNKKGNVEDLFYVIAVLFALSIILAIIYYTYTQIQTPMAENLNQTWDQADEVLEQTRSGLGFFDVMFPFLMIGVILWVCISAYFVRTYPFMFFFSIIVLIFVILLAAIFANVHGEMIRDNPQFSDTASTFAITGWIINRLPFIALGTAIIVFIILYAKWGGQETVI